MFYSLSEILFQQCPLRMVAMAIARIKKDSFHIHSVYIIPMKQTMEPQVKNK